MEKLDGFVALHQSEFPLLEQFYWSLPSDVTFYPENFEHQILIQFTKYYLFTWTFPLDYFKLRWVTLVNLIITLTSIILWSWIYSWKSGWVSIQFQSSQFIVSQMNFGKRRSFLHFTLLGDVLVPMSVGSRTKNLTKKWPIHFVHLLHPIRLLRYWWWMASTILVHPPAILKQNSIGPKWQLFSFMPSGLAHANGTTTTAWMM